MFLKNIIVVLLFFYYCFGDGDICPEVKESLGSPLYNRVLVGHVIKTLLTREGLVEFSPVVISVCLCLRVYLTTTKRLRRNIMECVS